MNPTLKKGSKGERVTGLQEGLLMLGYDPGDADGIFGPKTEQAVKAFQTNWSLEVDGVVGPATWSALEEAFTLHAAEAGA
jgi:peptidoglycan hydrolase-like protein with peptidoglycan-binding domain